MLFDPLLQPFGKYDPGSDYLLLITTMSSTKLMYLAKKKCQQKNAKQPNKFQIATNKKHQYQQIIITEAMLQKSFPCYYFKTYPLT